MRTASGGGRRYGRKGSEWRLDEQIVLAAGCGRGRRGPGRRADRWLSICPYDLEHSDTAEADEAPDIEQFDGGRGAR